MKIQFNFVLSHRDVDENFSSPISSMLSTLIWEQVSLEKEIPLSTVITTQVSFSLSFVRKKKKLTNRMWENCPKPPFYILLIFSFNLLNANVYIPARVCQPQDVTLHLKAGSYPVISPENITFPKHFLSAEQRFVIIYDRLLLTSGRSSTYFLIYLPLVTMMVNVGG